MNWAAISWLILLVFFCLVEVATVSVVSLWFAAGSLVAAIAAMLGAQLWLQVAVFLVVSGVALAALRPMVRRFFTPKLTKTNVDSVIGSTGLITVAVDNIKAEGRAKLGAMEWTARSTSGEPIPKDTLVRVDRIEGVKVFVTPVAVAAEV